MGKSLKCMGDFPKLTGKSPKQMGTSPKLVGKSPEEKNSALVRRMALYQRVLHQKSYRKPVGFQPETADAS